MFNLFTVEIDLIERIESHVKWLWNIVFCSVFFLILLFNLFAYILAIIKDHEMILELFFVFECLVNGSFFDCQGPFESNILPLHEQEKIVQEF